MATWKTKDSVPNDSKQAPAAATTTTKTTTIIIMMMIIIPKAEPSIFISVPTSSANCTKKFTSLYGRGDTTQHSDTSYLLEST